MNATEHFRFVERQQVVKRDVEGNEWKQSVRVLQQWWGSEMMIDPALGEWRDVPLLPEDTEPPRGWQNPGELVMD